MTFLELCQTVHRECGVAGSIVSVTDATGMLKRICEYVNKANRKIQLRKGNWKFLWSEWTLTTVTNISEYNPPDLLDSFDEKSFWLNAGTVDSVKLEYVDYKKWRDYYRNSFIESGEVSVVTVKPNGMINILPKPRAGGDIIYCDYWKTPIDLVNNSQVSLIPAKFHGAIVAQAKQYYAEFTHDTGLYNSAFVEHEQIYNELKSHSLPGNQEDSRSESSVDLIIEVE